MRASASIEDPVDNSALPPGFAQFYTRHYDFVWRCALRMGVSTDDADDIVQECFLVALRRFDSFDPGGRARPSTWLFAILRNVQRNHARATRRRRARLELLARTSDGPELRGADSSLAGRLLDDFLDTLDEDRRAAFVLAEIEGMTGPELARALELNLNTANSRLRTARHAFRRYFDEPDTRERAEALVGRAAKTRAPEASRQHGLALIGLSATKLASTSPALGWLGLEWLAALIFSAASVGAVAIAANAQPSTPPHARVPVASAPARTPEIDSVPPRPAPALEPELAPMPEPEPTPTPLPRQRKSPIERLAEARQALLDEDPERVLSLVEGREFPSELDGRRIVLEVEALCRLDRRAQAEARARAWRDRHPDDSTAAVLHDVCWSE